MVKHRMIDHIVGQQETPLANTDDGTSSTPLLRKRELVRRNSTMGTELILNSLGRDESDPIQPSPDNVEATSSEAHQAEYNHINARLDLLALQMSTLQRATSDMLGQLAAFCKAGV